MLRKSIVTLVSVLFFVLSAQAEMRIWSDKKGNTVEAEFVAVIGTKVVLKKTDGSQIKVPMDGLCEADKEYLASTIPPKLKITVDLDKDRDTVDSYSSTYGTYNYERKEETTKCDVTIEKTSREPCNQQFVGKVYVLGKSEKSDQREVISYEEEKFSFEYKDTVSFKTKPATVQYTRSNYAREGGTRYEGYFVVVENSEGKVVAMESSQGTYEKNVHKFKKAKKGTRFDGDFDIYADDD